MKYVFKTLKHNVYDSLLRENADRELEVLCNEGFIIDDIAHVSDGECRIWRIILLTKYEAEFSSEEYAVSMAEAILN